MSQCVRDEATELLKGRDRGLSRADVPSSGVLVGMTESTHRPRGKVPLKPFLTDFRSAMSDQELKAKYSLSPRAYLNLVKALLDRRLVTQEEVSKRKEMSVQRDLAKEAQFLAGLYICPNCGHPNPKPFKKCPACEMDISGALPVQDTLAAVTTTGGHFYVEDIVGKEGMAEIVEAEAAPDERQYPPTVELNAIPDEEETPEKKSAMSSLRSLFSRKQKKE